VRRSALGEGEKAVTIQGMAKKIVYIETSIPSAYVEDRRDLTSRFQLQQTRIWWERYSRYYALVSSEAVLAELRRTPFPRQAEAIDLVRDLTMLPVTEEVSGAARIYQKHLLMPRGHLGDAVHMALACVHEVDFLLTWNCRHLANPHKVEHLRVINMRLGLVTPMVLTPQMLIQE